jgi:uncharacterized alpha-E superfamily protein
MLSRIADSLYWLSRYMERTDGLIRMMRTNYILSLDKGEYGTALWQPVLGIFSSATEDQCCKLENNSTAAIEWLLVDAKNSNSVKSVVMRARENARGAQDHITKELWEQVNQLYHVVSNINFTQKIAESKVLTFLDNLSDHMLLYQGVAECTMPRNMGWHFMNVGKYQERSLLTLEAIDRHFQLIQYDPQENKDVLFWRNLLLTLSGFELYLKTYSSARHNLNVVDQMMFNQEFTRSVRFCLDRIHEELETLILVNQPEEKEKLAKCFGRVYSKVAYAEIENVYQGSLETYLHDLRLDLQQSFRLFTQIFFSYS